MKLPFAGLLFAVLTAPSVALAASPAVETAMATLAVIETDKAKLDPYCALVAEMNAAGNDQAKLDSLGEQLDGLLRSFGPAFESAVDLHNELDDASADGVAMIAAFEKIDKLCTK